MQPQSNTCSYRSHRMSRKSRAGGRGLLHRMSRMSRVARSAAGSHWRFVVAICTKRLQQVDAVAQAPSHTSRVQLRLGTTATFVPATLALILTALALILTACGGDDGDTSTSGG